MKIKDLDQWPPQEWKSDAKTLAPEDALDGADVSMSITVDQPHLIVVSVTHNEQTYTALLRVPKTLARRVALVSSGAGPEKTLREVGELEIDSAVSA